MPPRQALEFAAASLKSIDQDLTREEARRAELRRETQEVAARIRALTDARRGILRTEARAMTERALARVREEQKAALAQDVPVAVAVDKPGGAQKRSAAGSDGPRRGCAVQATKAVKKAPKAPPAASACGPRVQGAGRRPRFHGLCMACCKRALGEAGGPAHTFPLCAKTKAWLLSEHGPVRGGRAKA